ncbi:hypothetical protein [Balneatrix alpica]|uniref:hypothetical protein n=1 Tax=Balneatrix alpica TaxID=75684 RepID=UPI002738B620|nr:hypothetical protein [Balneatrix alpica]
MPVWLKTMLVASILLILVGVLGVWLQGYWRRWQIKEKRRRLYVQHARELIDALDALHDCCSEEVLYEPFRTLLRRVVAELKPYGASQAGLVSEMEDVLQLKPQNKDEVLYLTKQSLREVEYLQLKLQQGLHGLQALAQAMGIADVHAKALQQRLKRLTSRMKVCTLMHQGQLLEDEARVEQALIMYRHAQRELGRWVNPDAFMRGLQNRIRDSMTRLGQIEPNELSRELNTLEQQEAAEAARLRAARQLDS